MMNVSHIGGGSSFDSIEHNPLTIHTLLTNWKKAFAPQRYLNLGLYLKRFFRRGQKMDVLDRWKNFLHNASFQQIFLDKEILELSEENFGEMPGTREFVRGLKA